MDLGPYLAPLDDLSLFAVVCFALAAMNLIPLPLINGGNAIMYFVSSVLWPLTPRAQEMAFRVSLFVILPGVGSWLSALIYLAYTSWSKALFAFLVCGVLT